MPMPFLHSLFNRKHVLKLIAVIAATITFFWQFHPLFKAEKFDPAFYGRWISEYEYSDGPGTTSIRAVTEYQENGTYRVIAFLTANITTPNAKIVYRIDGTGDWEGNSKRLITKLNNRTESIVSFDNGSYSLTTEQIKKLPIKPPKITAQLPPGTPETYKTLLITQERISLQVDDLAGNPITFDMTRTKNRLP
jgi:hypothetical protein